MIENYFQFLMQELGASLHLQENQMHQRNYSTLMHVSNNANDYLI